MTDFLLAPKRTPHEMCSPCALQQASRCTPVRYKQVKSAGLDLGGAAPSWVDVHYNPPLLPKACGCFMLETSSLRFMLAFRLKLSRCVTISHLNDQPEPYIAAVAFNSDTDIATGMTCGICCAHFNLTRTPWSIRRCISSRRALI